MNITGNPSSRGLRSFSPSISAMNANFTDSQTTPLLFSRKSRPSRSPGPLLPAVPSLAPVSEPAFPSASPTSSPCSPSFATHGPLRTQIPGNFRSSGCGWSSSPAPQPRPLYSWRYLASLSHFPVLLETYPSCSFAIAVTKPVGFSGSEMPYRGITTGTLDA